MSTKLSSCFLLLAVSFLTLCFSSSIIKAQNSSMCEKGYKFDSVYEFELEQVTVYDYDPVERRNVPRTEWQNVRKLRWKCVPIPSETNSTTSSSSSNANSPNSNEVVDWISEGFARRKAKSNSSYPNVVRDTEGKFNPASGYRWVNPNDPKDFSVELIPGLIKTKDGFRPDKGYRWVNPKDPKNFRVERIP